MAFTLPEQTEKLVSDVRHIRCGPFLAHRALRLMNFTALEGTESNDTIKAMCRDAQDIGAASVCVLPANLSAARNAIFSDSHVRLATVVNFSDGAYQTDNPLSLATPISVTDDVEHAIGQGADVIHIVMDYEGFLKARYNQDADGLYQIGKLLEAATEACIGRAQCKIVVESEAYADFHDLRDACQFALQYEPHGLVSDTKYRTRHGITLEKAAIMMQIAQKNGCRIELSGDVTPDLAAQIITMADIIMGGEKEVSPEYVNIGAGRLFHDLHSITVPNFRTDEDLMIPPPGF